MPVEEGGERDIEEKIEIEGEQGLLHMHLTNLQRPPESSARCSATDRWIGGRELPGLFRIALLFNALLQVNESASLSPYRCGQLKGW